MSDVNPEEQFDEYKEEQEDLNDSKVFEETYGFEHNCRCADDWAEGNVGLVSECYMTMCETAMEALKEAREQNRELSTELTEFKLANTERGDGG